MGTSGRDRWDARVRLVVEAAEAFAAVHSHDYEARRKWCAEHSDEERAIFLAIRDNTPTASTRPADVHHLDPSLPGLAELSYELRDAALAVCWSKWEQQ